MMFAFIFVMNGLRLAFDVSRLSQTFFNFYLRTAFHPCYLIRVGRCPGENAPKSPWWICKPVGSAVSQVNSRNMGIFPRCIAVRRESSTFFVVANETMTGALVIVFNPITIISSYEAYGRAVIAEYPQAVALSANVIAKAAVKVASLSLPTSRGRR